MNFIPVTEKEFFKQQELKHIDKFVSIELMLNGDLDEDEECPTYLGIAGSPAPVPSASRVLVKFGDGSVEAFDFRCQFTGELRSIYFLKADSPSLQKAARHGISKLRMLTGGQVRDISVDIDADTFAKVWEPLRDKYRTVCRQMFNGEDF